MRAQLAKYSVAALWALAQDPTSDRLPMNPEETRSRMMQDLQGSRESIEVVPPFIPRLPVGPPTISAKRLRHKVPKKASSLLKESTKLGSAGKVDDAIAKLAEAIRIDPSFVEAHTDLGVLYYGTGRIQDAAREFKLAVALDPDSSVTQTNLGWLLLLLGDKEGATMAARRALQLLPENARAHLLAGAILVADPATLREGMTHMDLAATAFRNK